MKITKKQLKLIIENYLKEQDDVPPDEEAEVEEPADDEAVEDETPVDDEETPVDDEETPVDDEPVDDMPESFKSFEVVVDNMKHKIQFKKDSLGEKIHAFVDGVQFKNAKMSDMLALAGVGLTGVQDEETRKGLHKIVQLDNTFKNKDEKASAELIKNKMNGSRFPFDNIAGIIKKAQG